MSRTAILTHRLQELKPGELIGHLAVLEDEILSDRTKFPSRDMLFIALVEELGELATEIIEGRDDYRGEALQVACVALRIASEGLNVDSESPALLAAVAKLEAAARAHMAGVPSGD